VLLVTAFEKAVAVINRKHFAEAVVGRSSPFGAGQTKESKGSTFERNDGMFDNHDPNIKLLYGASKRIQCCLVGAEAE
jgi:hypothetical protein